MQSNSNFETRIIFASVILRSQLDNRKYVEDEIDLSIYLESYVERCLSLSSILFICKCVMVSIIE